LGIEYIIMHKRFEADFNRPPPVDFSSIVQRYRRDFETSYEDACIVVFGLDTEKSIAMPVGVRSAADQENVETQEESL
jgi:hypothetical protein